jgi:hypothetical protein
MATIKTSSRNPFLPLLFVGVARVLRNVWVWLHAEVMAQPRRGGCHLQAAAVCRQDARSVGLRTASQPSHTRDRVCERLL